MTSSTILTNLKGDKGDTVVGPQGPQGLAGPTATPADAAVAGYVSTSGSSQTKTAVNANLSARIQAGAAASPSRFNVADLSGPVGTKLTIPTVDAPAGGQPTHCSVLAFPEKWGGYEYWMAFTPYPGGVDSFENPHIVASHDGVTWTIPTGGANPIDTAPGTPIYNSDTELVLGPDGALWLFWRNVNSNTNIETVFLCKSADGITWSAKVDIMETSLLPLPHLLSPTLVLEDGGWSMWGVDMSASPNTLVRYRSSTQDLTAPTDWGSAIVCPITGIMSGKEAWHVEIRRVGGQYIALLVVCDTAVSGENGMLQILTSDDGLNWAGSSTSVIPQMQNGQHDRLYRSSFVPQYVGGTLVLRTWYAGVLSTSPSVWNIFLTQIGSSSNTAILSVPAGDPIPAGTPANRLIARLHSGGPSEVRRNYVTNSAPATKIDYWDAGYAGGGTVTNTRETTGGPAKGSPAWSKNLWTAAASSTTAYMSFGSNTVDNIAVTASAEWTFSAWLYASWAVPASSVRVLFYNAAGTTIGSEVVGLYYPHAAGTWQRRSLTVTTPAGAVRAAIRGYFQNAAAAAGAIAGMSSLFVAPGNVLYDYSDGAITPDAGLTPSWVGVAYTSQSILTADHSYMQFWDGAQGWLVS